MLKIEIIWREILENARRVPLFEQKKLASKLRFSTSTVFAAISPLRAIGAIGVTGRNFRILDMEKILLYWATHRNLSRDIIYSTRMEAPVMEIEGLADNKTIYAGYSAARFLLGSSPSEYAKVYLYSDSPSDLKKRFPANPGNPNIFILKADPYLSAYGGTTPVSQTYVDIWNMGDWYAKEFLEAIKRKYYGFL